MLLDVLNVCAQPNYSLLLEFENGEQRRFDMAPYIEQKPWVRIKARELFCQAAVNYGTVTWPGNVDIDPETLYERSILLPN